MNNIIKRVWVRNRMVNIDYLGGSAFYAEDGGHTFQISGAESDGSAVALSGTVAGVFLRPDNTDVAITGSCTGGVVSVTLPANCYDVPGRFGLTIFLTADDQKTAIYAAVGNVARTSSGAVAPQTTADVVDLINRISAAVATIPQSWTGLMADIAPTYSASAVYPAGAYVYYNGDLYRCTTAITTAETWTPAHWTTANLGTDLRDLKAALNVIISDGNAIVKKTLNWQNGYVSTNSGVIVSSSVSGFALVQLLKGETVRIITKATSLAMISSTTANSVSVGDTVTVIKAHSNTNQFEECSYTAEEDINIVLCGVLSNCVVSFYENKSESNPFRTIDLGEYGYRHPNNQSNRLVLIGYADMVEGERLRVHNLQRGYAWMAVSCNPGEQDTDKTGWITKDGEYYVEEAGSYRLWYKKTDNTDIGVTDITSNSYIDIFKTREISETIEQEEWTDANAFSGETVEILHSEYGTGWIGDNGTIQPVYSEVFPEVYTTAFFDVKPGDVIKFALKSIARYHHWLSVAIYDKNKTYITRVQIYSMFDSYVTESSGQWINTDSDYAYVRFSFRACCYGDYTFKAVKYSGDLLTKPSVIEYKNKYIRTDQSIGSTLPMTLISYQNWITLITDCYSGDKFVVSGCGGGEGRLWAFIDGNNKLLSHAPANYQAEAEEIEAPNKARKLIFSASTYSDYALSRGRSDISQNAIARALIDNPYIIDPGDKFEKPTVAFHNPQIQEDTRTVNTKFGIFKNGSNMCITYTEDVDHTNKDYPDLSESGKMEYHYRYFHFNNNAESDISYGLVAKKGSAYIDRNGQSQTMDGGVSFGSSVNSKLFFSFAYMNTNIGGIDYKPCMCSVSVDENGVTFGTIYELILVINGESGEFNTERFGGWELAFYTSNPPYYDSNGYKWLLPVEKGFAYLTSTDGITWTCENVCNTPYYTYKETSATKITDELLLFAARTNDNNYTRDGFYTFIGIYNISRNSIDQQYRIPSGVCKPLVLKCGTGSSDNLLVVTDPTFTHATYYKVLYRNTLEFVKWFEMYHDATYYANILQDTLIGSSKPTEMFIVGGNGQIGNHSSGFVKLEFGTTKPRDIRDIPFAVL